MKKILLSLSAFAFISTTVVASENMAKGLNVMLTSEDAQTQMMGMVLATMSLKKGKEVNIVLCSSAGNLALKDSESPKLKPQNKSPKMMLEDLIKNGAKVEVCPLFLPNAEKTEADLIQNVTVAKPPVVADRLLDKDYQNLSY
ncbi:DsrE family protein [Aliarcobacter cryaerophilus]|uniref:DsrE family protein n=1 Tax=Aliarcobacter cryaerophilus TaxID=28198 RepID=UPI0021B65616|nr:DsrE family protein [Aliarcobacter cryaerophilus]MCT7516476.1 DsrE family protein [Aliarcobacter cryaerophilus]